MAAAGYLFLTGGAMAVPLAGQAAMAAVLLAVLLAIAGRSVTARDTPARDIGHSARQTGPDAVKLMDISDLPTFLDEYRDQSLWLRVVEGLDLKDPQASDVFEAMLRHPACENAVATALLDLCGAVEAFGPQAARFARQRARCYNLVRVIVERDFTVGYPARGLGDPDWLNRSALVTEIQTIAQAVPESDTAALPVPVDLLTTVPFGPPAHDRYRVDGSGVYRLG